MGENTNFCSLPQIGLKTPPIDRKMCYTVIARRKALRIMLSGQVESCLPRFGWRDHSGPVSETLQESALRVVLPQEKLPQEKKKVHNLATDMSLRCRDCGNEFVFTVGEQEFYASRGLTNTPSRCPECRAARKASQGGGSSYSSGGGRPRGGQGGGQRQLYSAICSNCGREALVPFQPRGDKPVYCSDCFQQISSSRY